MWRLLGPGVVLLLSVIEYPFMGAWVFVPLALGGLVAAAFGARRDVDHRQAIIGMTAGVVTWALVGLAVALVVFGFE